MFHRVEWDVFGSMDRRVTLREPDLQDSPHLNAEPGAIIAFPG